MLVKSLELAMLSESVMPFGALRSIMEMTSQARNRLLQGNTVEPQRTDLNTGKLSVKEAQVLTYLRDGTPNKVVANKLEITEATVKAHVKAIMRKIGVSNRTQAAIWATQRLPRRGGASVNV